MTRMMAHFAPVSRVGIEPTATVGPPCEIERLRAQETGSPAHSQKRRIKENSKPDSLDNFARRYARMPPYRAPMSFAGTGRTVGLQARQA